MRLHRAETLGNNGSGGVLSKGPDIQRTIFRSHWKVAEDILECSAYVDPGEPILLEVSG